MPNVSEILQILQIVAQIIAALRDMGMKVTGEVNIADILKIVGPKA
jgi:uncharacterized protein (DUF302 family)